MAPMPESSADSFADKIQNFISENKKVILIGTGLAAVAAGGTYFYLNSQRASKASGGDDQSSESSTAKAKEKKKKSRKKKGGSKDTGPILEERKPEEVDIDDEPRMTAAEIEALSMEDRAARAAVLKAKGNDSYSKKKFSLAAEYYTRAIAVTPRAEAVFYSNRAACYLNMVPAQHELVVNDCDEALKIDPNYVKALNRRAGALEILKRYSEALRDFTASTILDKFRSPSTAQAVERVIKQMSIEEATKILKSRELRLPSASFMAAYFAAFRKRDLPTLPENPTTADQQLLLALQALEAADYNHAFTLVNECLSEAGPSWTQGQAEAYNLRGTFMFMCGDSAAAQKDILHSTELSPSYTQSWVKLASVYMEQADAEKAFASFETAISHNKDDPDIYYHRGQVYFIMNEWKNAIEDYTMSSKLDDTFVFSHIQLAVAQYKAGNVANSMATFRRTLKQFPTLSEPANYYGELLLDQTRFQEAIEKFDKAIELEKQKTKSINVLPMVNKGLALFQSKQDAVSAIKLCQEALIIDTENEAAVATLAQLNLQQGNVTEALKMFNRHCELARTEPELTNALTYKYATEAQIEFLQNYPHMAAQMGQIAQSMMV